ncbi:hypothetical protein D9M71_506520 [compost metagenome]
MAWCRAWTATAGAVDLLARGVAHAHRQADAFARDVDFHDLDLDHVASLDCFTRVLDELLRQRRDVHQAVLVHADVDEGTEVGDVGHHAFEDHARFQVLEVFDAVLEGGGLELGAWVAAGLVQFLQDVGDGRQTEAFVGELLRVQALEEAAVTDQRADVAVGVGGNALHQRVGLGVHRGGVQRVVAVHHT